MAKHDDKAAEVWGLAVVAHGSGWRACRISTRGSVRALHAQPLPKWKAYARMQSALDTEMLSRPSRVTA